jgi:hypothetical protein
MSTGLTSPVPTVSPGTMIALECHDRETVVVLAVVCQVLDLGHGHGRGQVGDGQDAAVGARCNVGDVVDAGRRERVPSGVPMMTESLAVGGRR